MPGGINKKPNNGQGNDSSSKCDTKDKLEVVAREKYKSQHYYFGITKSCN